MDRIISDWQLDRLMAENAIEAKKLAHVTQIAPSEIRRYRSMTGCPQMTVFTMFRLLRGLNSLTHKKITLGQLFGIR